jgi:hypothetical protein
MFDMVIKNTGPDRWEWEVCKLSGKPLIFGYETTQRAARYHAERALFLLLLAGFRKIA